MPTHRTTFLGYEIRVTDAIPEGHIMVQSTVWPHIDYLFFGRDARYSLAWAHAMNGNAIPFLEIMHRSAETRRSVSVRG